MATRTVGAFDGLDLEISQLKGLTTACREGLRGLIRSSIQKIQADARARLNASRGKYWTGRTYEAIRTITFDDGDTGKVYVGQMWDVDGASRPVNLPLWIEYGTIHQHAKPFLIPAFERERVKFGAEALALLERAAR